MTASDAAAASPASTQVPAVQLIGVNKSYGSKRALVDVDLRIAPATTTVIIGPSGSGKSTLCRTINRLEVPDSGEIRIGGVPQPVAGRALSALRADVGMVFQGFNLFPQMTILENVAYGPVKVRHLPDEQARDRAMELLRRVGVADQAPKLPAELSGGQQQRAAIARCLAMEPEIMLFDEPTSALDPEMVAEVLAIMEALSSQRHTMICVTHEMGFARHVADVVVFMADGRLLEQGPPDEFFERPTTERAREFLASVL